MKQDVSRCMALGFNAFLSKPCRKETVRAKVRELVAAHAAAMEGAQVRTSAQPAILQCSPGSRCRILPSPALTSTSNGQIMATLPLAAGSSSAAGAGGNSPMLPSANGAPPSSSSSSASLAQSAAQRSSRMNVAIPPSPHGASPAHRRAASSTANNAAAAVPTVDIG